MSSSDETAVSLPGIDKCARTPGGTTGGAATDIRVSWPACDLWERAEQPA